MIETKEYIVDGKPFTVSIDKEEQFLKDHPRAVLKVDVPGKQESSTSGAVVEAATTVTPTVEQNQETDLSQNNQQVNTELPSEDGSLESPETSEQPLKFEASDELLNKLLNLGKLNSNSNLDSTNKATLYILQTDAESVLFDLEAGKTFMLGNAEFNASQGGDYVDVGYVDETYYSSFTNFDTIKAKAHTSDIQLEYFVASS